MGPNIASLSVVHAYRHLYRGLLHAVQYSAPNRYTARNQLRHAFRKGDPRTFDPARVMRTLKFLEGAARERGLEHRILKSLLHTAFHQNTNIAGLVIYKRSNRSQSLPFSQSTPQRQRGAKVPEVHNSFALSVDYSNAK